MISRLLAWLWQRIQDIDTGLTVLEGIGWKTKLAATLAAIATVVATLLSEAKWYYVFGLSLSSALVVLGVVIAWQNYKLGKQARPIDFARIKKRTSPFKPDFGDRDGLNRVDTERSSSGLEPGERTIWHLMIENEGEKGP